jgi:hypothetical protein
LPTGAQVKEIEATEILSDDILDTPETNSGGESPKGHASLNALSVIENNDRIQIRALVGDKVMLLLIDSGSTYSFVDKSLVEKLQLKPTDIPQLKVKVGNGEVINCTTTIPDMSW